MCGLLYFFWSFVLGPSFDMIFNKENTDYPQCERVGGYVRVSGGFVFVLFSVCVYEVFMGSFPSGQLL